MSRHHRLRIGYIVPGFPANETDWFIPAVSETILLVAERHDVRVVTLRYPRERRAYRIRHVPVAATGNHGFRTLRAGVRQVLVAHRRAPFDLLHAFWATEAGAVGAVAAWRLGLPLVVTCAGGELVDRPDLPYGDWRTFRMRGFIRAALGRADVILAGSAYQRDLITARKTTWGEKTVRLPLGVDTHRFQPVHDRLEAAPDEDEHLFTLIHVAGLTPVKNHHILFRTLARLKDRPWRIALVGDGPLKHALRTYSRTLGIEDRIRWHGWTPHAEMPAYYRRADLCVLTSEHEAQGVALLEGMACGLPVVSTAVGLAPELIAKADNGICVPCGDEQALAEGIRTFLDHPAFRVEAGARSRRTAEDFSRDATVGKLTAAYHRLVQEEAAPESPVFTEGP